jgi:predicted Zn-dependent peptidase
MYSKTVLDNGLRVVSEQITQVRSVALGLWVNCGSRHEEDSHAGISHFIEHMLFKGTSSRTAREIAAAVDSMGGFINACTSKENTVYYLKVPDYHLKTAVFLLADMLLNSCLAGEEIEKEKTVVFEEMSLGEDSPEDYVHDFFDLSFWPGQALGRQVLGCRESVASFHREMLLSFLSENYGAQNIVIAAAGNFQHDDLLSHVAAAFRGISCLSSSPPLDCPIPKPGIQVSRRDLEQVHLVIGAAGPGAREENRFAALLASSILGGSMSSRLFQEIREKRGLAYGVGSFMNFYRDVGVFGIYCACAPPKVSEVLRLIRTEIIRLQETPVPLPEMERIRDFVKGNFLLSMESTDSRMTRLARNELNFGRFIAPEEFADQVDRVTVRDIQEQAKRVLVCSQMNIAAVGDVEKDELASIWNG